MNFQERLVEKSLLEKKRMSDYQFLLYYGEILKEFPLPAIGKGGRPLDSGLCVFCKYGETCNRICRFWKWCNICKEQKHIFDMTSDSVSRENTLGICRNCRKEIHSYFNLNIPGRKPDTRNVSFYGRV